MSNVLARIFSWLMVAVIGFAFGTAGTFGVYARPNTIPLGLVISLVGVTAILIAVRLLADDRWSVIFAAVGVYAAILVFSLRGPGGSVVLPDAPSSMIWMYGSALIILVVAAWPDLSRLRTAATTRDVTQS